MLLRNTTYIAYFNRFEWEIDGHAVEDIATQGSNDEAVAYWVPRLTFPENADDIRAELKEYGAWDEKELADDEQNKHRLLWIAAHNIKEDGLTN